MSEKTNDLAEDICAQLRELPSFGHAAETMAYVLARLLQAREPETLEEATKLAGLVTASAVHLWKSLQPSH